MAVVPASPYLYCASSFFVASGFFSDLLILRLALACAYLFLLLAAASGFSVDGSFSSLVFADGNIDVIFIVNLFLFLLHLSVVTRLVADEWEGGFASEDEEQLFQFFEARCGLKYVEFKTILQHGHWLQLGPDEAVPDCHDRLYVVVEGWASCRALFNGQWTDPLVKRSGQFMDLHMMNAFTLPIGLENSRFQAQTETSTLLFYWTTQDIQAMQAANPLLRRFWQFVILRSLAGEVVKHHLAETDTLFDSLNIPEDQAWLQGARSRDFTTSSCPAKSHRLLVRLWQLLVASFSLYPPRGIRHSPYTQPPSAKPATGSQVCHAESSSPHAAKGGGAIDVADPMSCEFRQVVSGEADNSLPPSG
eukprot:jgi/Tetstr1/431207/TSEL_020919.t1